MLIVKSNSSEKVIKHFVALAVVLSVVSSLFAENTTSDGWQYEVNDGKATIVGHNNARGILSIPQSIDGYPVTSIEYDAFSGCSGLKTVTIPDSVTSIGQWAFSGCSDLKTVTIPDSVTSIGQWAFFGCSDLKTVTIPDSVTSIGERAFSHCSGLKTVSIPSGITSIGEEAFSHCDSLKIVYTQSGNVAKMRDMIKLDHKVIITTTPFNRFKNVVLGGAIQCCGAIVEANAALVSSLL